MDFPLIKLNNKAPQIVFLYFDPISNKKTPEYIRFRSFNYIVFVFLNGFIGHPKPS